jgi:hypothetical protein
LPFIAILYGLSVFRTKIPSLREVFGILPP